MMDGEVDWGLGVGVNFHKKEGKKGRMLNQTAEPVYLFDVMVYCQPRDASSGAPPKPAKLT